MKIGLFMKNLFCKKFESNQDCKFLKLLASSCSFLKRVIFFPKNRKDFTWFLSIFNSFMFPVYTWSLLKIPRNSGLSITKLAVHFFPKNRDRGAKWAEKSISIIKQKGQKCRLGRCTQRPCGGGVPKKIEEKVKIPVAGEARA